MSFLMNSHSHVDYTKLIYCLLKKIGKIHEYSENEVIICMHHDKNNCRNRFETSNYNQKAFSLDNKTYYNITEYNNKLYYLCNLCFYKWRKEEKNDDYFELPFYKRYSIDGGYLMTEELYDTYFNNTKNEQIIILKDISKQLEQLNNKYDELAKQLKEMQYMPGSSQYYQAKESFDNKAKEQDNNKSLDED